MSFRNEKGQLLLITLLVMGGVFAVGMAVGLAFLNEARTSRQSLDSVKAIYAAQSGLEFELYKCFKNPSAAAPPMTNGTCYTSQTTTGAATTSHAIGLSLGVRRGLDVGIDLPCVGSIGGLTSTCVAPSPSPSPPPPPPPSPTPTPPGKK